jgi:SAM-dependent methyltransferase
MVTRAVEIEGGRSPQAGGGADLSHYYRPGWEVFGVSFLILFAEMALIRWIPANVRVMAYFSSILLVGCFLGTGVGCILRSTRDLFGAFPWSVLLLNALAAYLARAGVRNPATGFVFRAGIDRYSWLVAVPVIFLFTALPFVFLGQRLARGLGKMAPLRGYTLNLLGSLAGTIAFAVLSSRLVRPSIWFALCGLLAIALLLNRPAAALLAAVATLILTLMVQDQAARFLWSPYYKIEVSPASAPEGLAYSVTVNNDYHQLILNLSPWASAHSVSLLAWARTYDFPYLFVRAAKPTVLVLGAGTGNDAAAAFRNGAQRVDAVELDPVIARLGAALHPERPYADSRLRLFVDDARSFLNSATGRYDLVVLGWLDSHRVFSNLSNVRQDNFVYTVESMRKAMGLLKPNGALVLSFYAGKPWVADKIFALLHRATGRLPRVFASRDGGYGRDGTIFVVTADGRWPAGLPPAGFVELSKGLPSAPGAVPPTDNWPFLYWQKPGISPEYLGAILAILAIATVMVVPQLRFTGLAAREGLHFFLLGAGFLLLEVRNITALALVFGSTWLVTSLTVAAVLVMALIANGLVAAGFGARHRAMVWVALFASIACSLLWSRVGNSAADPQLRAFVTTLVVSATFVFSGLVFARSFSRTKLPGAALGLNVLGSVVGGLTEFASLSIGIEGLSVIALVIYGAALASVARRPIRTLA